MRNPFGNLKRHKSKISDDAGDARTLSEPTTRVPSAPPSPALNGMFSRSASSSRTPESPSTTATTQPETADTELHKSTTAETQKTVSPDDLDHARSLPSPETSPEAEDDGDDADNDIASELDSLDLDDLPTDHHERIILIEDILRDTLLNLGHTYYLIGGTWWDRFFDDPFDQELGETREEKPEAIPPLEYAENTGEEGRIIPSRAYILLKHWYGTTRPVRRHSAIEVGDEHESKLILETCKPTLYLYPLGNVDGLKEIRVMEDVSLSTPIEDIVAQLNLKDVRIWHMTKGSPQTLPLTISEFRKSSCSNLLENDKRLYHYSFSPIEHLAVEQKSAIGWMSRTATINRTYITPGVSGLSNLGNSCYMNSALQCLLHAEELASYFISKTYQNDVNRTNPIGYKGDVATAFANLVESTFFSKSTTYSPREFKNIIGRYGRTFAGFMQQDTQEFLAFLLDGLHEDLNRITDKPSTDWPELTDDQIHDEKILAELADNCWRLHKLRNDSAVLDLFSGLYRSTLVCPECTKRSVTFDPYMDLTLPLPNDNLWLKEIQVLPKDGRIKRLEIGIDRHSTIRQLKDYVADKIGLTNSIPLISSEIYNYRFYKHHENWALVSEKISADDHIIVYELDRVPDKEEDDEDEEEVKDPDEKVFAVPVFNRVFGECSAEGNLHGGDFFGTPFFITLTNKEARDEQLIMDKVTARFKDEEQLPTLNYVEHKKLKEDPMTGWNISHNLIKNFSQRIPGNEPAKSESGSVKSSGSSGISQFASPTGIPSTREPEKPHGPPVLPELETYESFGDGLLEGDQGAKGTNGTSGVATGNRRGNNLEDTDQNLVSLVDDNALYLANDNSDTYTDVPLASGQFVYRGEGIVCDWGEHHAKEEIVRMENPALEELRQDREEMKENGITLDDCLDLFTKAELLSKDDLWYCSKCKVLRQATKTIDLWKVPDIFTIHIKRFASFRSFRDKLDDTVQFPLEGLDMTKRVACDDGKELIYDLFAVDNHFGGLGGGHYTAYAKNFFDGKWYYFDDGHVKETNPQNSISGSAYLLFYRRRNSGQPLGGEVLQQAVEVARKRLHETHATTTGSGANSIAETSTQEEEPEPRVAVCEVHGKMAIVEAEFLYRWDQSGMKARKKHMKEQLTLRRQLRGQGKI